MTKRKAEENSPLHNSLLVMEAWSAGQVTIPELRERLQQERVRAFTNVALYGLACHQAAPASCRECGQVGFHKMSCDAGWKAERHGSTVCQHLNDWLTCKQCHSSPNIEEGGYYIRPEFAEAMASAGHAPAGVRGARCGEYEA